MPTDATRELTVGVGAGELATADMVLNIGPQHPATHGVLRLRLVVDGERIVSAEPIVGYMHRGAEKLFEVRDYRQILVLANRHDWLSAFCNEIGVVLGVEAMLGMEVPERATWARTLLYELNRVLNHLMFLGSYPRELGAFVVAMCAGISTLVFLFIVGLSEYAVALAVVVTILDVIPMIGATLGAVVVTASAFATDPRTGLFCVVFFVLYQQVENYVVYPRVMSRSVDIPGWLIVIAALIGASLLGVVGALLAIPTAAALLLIVREVVVPRQALR